MNNHHESSQQPSEPDQSTNAENEVIRKPVMPIASGQQDENARSPKRVDRPVPEEQISAYLSEKNQECDEPVRKPIVPPQAD